MTDQQQQPLWHLMQEAYFAGRDSGCDERHGWAAVLRAIADRVEDMDPPECSVSNIGFSEYPSGFEHGGQVAIYAVVAMLMDEADRAEAGQ